MRPSIISCSLGLLALGAPLVHSQPTEPEPTAWVVTFDSALKAADRSDLNKTYGLQLDDHVPGVGYVERLSTNTADRIAAQVATGFLGNS